MAADSSRVRAGRLHTPSSVQVLSPGPPAWVQDLLGGPAFSRAGSVDIASTGRLSLLSTSVAGAARLCADDLRVAVTGVYRTIAGVLGSQALHPVRFWNFLPSPGEQMGDGLDRYMIFNTGRFDACAQWFGTPREFSHSLATASAVGAAGDDYVLYCLASVTPGVPVENPRQMPAWKYSGRYGPKPPCFARGTVAQIGGQPRLLIGGTASIVGEDSRHIGNVDAQVNETLCNMATLIAAARRDPAESTAAALARMTSIRIYVRNATDAAVIVSAVEQACRRDAAIETAIAELCRPELLVEIEAIADL
jgi:chorismate lyase / 3-hydroxybenzoate synthase